MEGRKEHKGYLGQHDTDLTISMVDVVMLSVRPNSYKATVHTQVIITTDPFVSFNIEQ